MDDIQKVSIYLSAQPFWQAQKLNQALIFLEQTSEPVAFVYEMTLSAGVQSLQSVPGTGLICLSFSLDPKDQFAQCYGPLNQSKLIPVGSGGVRTFNCHFFPGQFTRIVGIPSHLLADKEVPIKDVLNIGSLIEEIATAPNFNSRTAIMQKTVCLWAARTKERKASQISHEFISLSLANCGDIRVKELEQQIGYSGRYLQKIISEQVGLAPKTAMENIRFQCALRMMIQHPAYPLSLIAQQNGFYDQAHFTKIFKKITGCTPAVFIQDRNKQFRKLKP